MGKHTKSAGDQILFPPHCTYSYSFLYTSVYKVVVVKLLDCLLDITARSELEAQAFLLTRINIC